MMACNAILVAAALVLAACVSPWSGLGVAATKVSSSGSLEVNNLVDNVMLTVQRQLSSYGLGSTELPDVAGTENGISIEASDGLMNNLASVYRSGEAAADYGDGNVTISTTFSLRTLEMSYLIKAKYGWLPAVTTTVGATIKENGVTMKAGIYWSGSTCYFGVQSLDVNTLDKITWRVSGFGIFNPLMPGVLNLIIPPTKVRGWIGSALGSALDQYQAPCINFIPGVGKGHWNCP